MRQTKKMLARQHQGMDGAASCQDPETSRRQRRLEKDHQNICGAPTAPQWLRAADADADDDISVSVCLCVSHSHSLSVSFFSVLGFLFMLSLLSLSLCFTLLTIVLCLFVYLSVSFFMFFSEKEFWHKVEAGTTTGLWLQAVIMLMDILLQVSSYVKKSETAVFQLTDLQNKVSLVI